ncbi:MAG: GGDEF domain-containing protein [Glaciecola sp.]
MSELSPKQQLMIAKQQLDKLSIFIASLADFFYGSSPAIDEDFQEIKKLLSGKPNYDKAAELSVGLNAILKKEAKFLKQKHADTLSQIQHGLRQLAELEAVDDHIKIEIKQFSKSLASDGDASKDSPVNVFEQALGLFKQALSNNVVSNNQQQQLAQSALHDDIVRELKELIHPHYKKNSTDPTLKETYQQLSEGVNHQDLLACCLVMIRFVMRDLITESSAATKLINDIHKSLVKINLGIKTTISKSKHRLNKREQQNKAVQAQISAMESTISDTHEITDLKKYTTEYLAKLQNSLHMSEQEERTEQEKVIALLHTMQKRLETLEKKANTYKSKLIEQRVNAMTDSLTKLPNRMAFDEKIAHDFAQLKEINGIAFLAILDIDLFKHINDKYGHSVGDKTLQIIANHMRKLLAKNDFVCRWGGEEFVAILYDEQQHDALNKIENLRNKIAKLPFMFKGTRVSITVSIGLTNLAHHPSVNDAFDAADKLLYKAKNTGRNQTCVEENE